MKSLGGMTRPKDEMGSQIVSSKSNISHPKLVYVSRNNNSQAHARSFPALTAPEPEFSVIFGSKWDPLTSAWRQEGARKAPVPRDSLNFRRSSLLSRNEFESGTFTIVLHATSSFTYVSVIYGANLPFKLSRIFFQTTCKQFSSETHRSIIDCIVAVKLFRKRAFEAPRSTSGRGCGPDATACVRRTHTRVLDAGGRAQESI